MEMLLECGLRTARGELPALKRRKGAADPVPVPGARLRRGRRAAQPSAPTQRHEGLEQPAHRRQGRRGEEQRGTRRTPRPHSSWGAATTGYCESHHNEPNSWMSVDLGEGRAVVPTHYCLRHDGNQRARAAQLDAAGQDGRARRGLGADPPPRQRRDTGDSRSSRWARGLGGRSGWRRARRPGSRFGSCPENDPIQ